MNKKLGLCCMVAALSTKISFAACIAGTWYDRFDTEFADQPTPSFLIPELLLLSDFICVGRIVAFNAEGRPQVEVLQKLYGPTNILQMTPDSFPQLIDEPVATTNIFFALTNDWWNINTTTTDDTVIIKNRQMTRSWEAVTNHPLDNAVFTNWFLFTGRQGLVSLDTNDTEEVVLYVSNLVHVAKIAKDKKAFFDTVKNGTTNAPIRLRQQLKWYYKARFFDPSKPRDLLKPLLGDYIDYDMLWEGLEGPDE